MAVHKVAEAFPEGASTSADDVRQKLASAFPLVLDDPDDIEDINFSQSEAVAVPEAIIAKVGGLGLIFWYDAADTTTPHNGTSVLVSDDNKRYKSSLEPGLFVSVVDIANAPPGSPAAGDKYIIGTAPSGAWASNADDLTIYDGADWLFVSPEIGQETYVRALASRGHWRWDETGEWVENSSVPDGAVTPVKLSFPWGAVAVEETATPPSGVIAAGTLYIVGVNATGLWDDEDTNIAESQGEDPDNPGETLWTFHVPYNGAHIVDADEAGNKRFDAGLGAWVSAVGAWVEVTEVFTASTGSTSTSGSGSYSYSATTAPTTSAIHRKDDASLTYAAKAAGTRNLRFRYAADVRMGTASGGSLAGDFVVMLLRDSGATAIDWCRPPLNRTTLEDLQEFRLQVEFLVDAPDTSSHTYKIALVGRANVNSQEWSTPSRRLFTVEERA